MFMSKKKSSSKKSTGASAVDRSTPRAHEQGAHSGNELGGESGAHADKQQRVGRELPAKYCGGHDSGKTHHETASRRDENKPQATPAKQLFAEVK